MCCTFNSEAAEAIYTDQTYKTMLTKLQVSDLNSTFENKTLPKWYTNSGEPLSQAGNTFILRALDNDSSINDLTVFGEGRGP